VETPAARRFARFAWGVLVYNLAVVAWGAFVRATGSGAGCGSHWPLCNGEVLPRPERVETLIEFSHRLSSAVDGLLVLALAVWAWRAFAPGHPARRAARAGALVAFAFLLSEAAIGAGLVRFELVADDASVARALLIGAHLGNTFILLAALALTAWWASGGAPPRPRGQGAVGALVALGAAGLLILGMSGAVTALGDTLFPAASLAEGLRRDFSPGAHFLLRLRVVHPVLAVAVGLGLAAAAAAVARRRATPEVRRWARRFAALYAAQIVLGFVNLALAAPVALQLVHLVLADLVWIAWVLLAGAALSGSPSHPPAPGAFLVSAPPVV
jgi:heme A synthase